MSSNLSVILSRLTETIYNLDTRVFTNRRVVKADSSVSTDLGSFTKALLQWESTDKEGKDVVSTGKFRILILNSSSDGDFSSLYETTSDTIDSYNSDCSNFTLTTDDFSSETPVGVQRYYVVRKNRLEVLESEVSNSGANITLNRYSIGKEDASLKTNAFTISSDSQATLDSTADVDAGVCKCDYSCGKNTCCSC